MLSFLIRVCERNGFRDIGDLLHYAGLPWKNRRAPIYKILTDEFDLSNYFVKLGLAHKVPHTAQAYGLFERISDTSFLFVKYPKVCPECIAEQGYCMSSWAYIPVMACVRHEKLLVDVDSTTGTRLSWYRGRLDSFESKQRIPVLPEPASPDVVQMSNYFELLSADKTVDFCVPDILKGLRFREALTLFHFIAHYQSRLQGVTFKPVSSENRAVSEHYRRVWSIVQKWPDSFYYMLNQYPTCQPSCRLT